MLLGMSVPGGDRILISEAYVKVDTQCHVQIFTCIVIVRHYFRGQGTCSTAGTSRPAMTARSRTKSQAPFRMLHFAAQGPVLSAA